MIAKHLAVRSSGVLKNTALRAVKKHMYPEKLLNTASSHQNIMDTLDAARIAVVLGTKETHLENKALIDNARKYVTGYKKNVEEIRPRGNPLGRIIHRPLVSAMGRGKFHAFRNMLSDSGHILPEHAYGYPVRANVHQTSITGTPLKISTSYPTKYMKLLLEKGARPSNKSGYQQSQALHDIHMHHRYNGQGPVEEKINLLLKHGANINARDRHGKTPLHHAAASPYKHSDITVEKLLERGADVRAVDVWGKTPLDSAIQYLQSSNGGHKNETRRVVRLLRNAERKRALQNR
jgi:hypothetical protein